MCPHRITLLMSVATLTGATLASAQPSHVEDFTTDVYKDAALTTANWNTASGALELFPFSPSIIGNLPSGDQARGLARDGNLVYVADMTAGLLIVDTYHPSTPDLLGTYDSPGQALDVAVDGGWAYLADDGSGVQVIDVSDPASPVPVGNYDPAGPVRGVFVHGNHLYVGCGSDGLRVLDVSTPSTPSLVGSLPLGRTAHDVWVVGDLAYVTSLFTTGGLHIVDVSHPEDPQLLSTTITAGSAAAVEVAGHYAFVADRPGGLLVFDVSDPVNPALVAVRSGFDAQDVCIDGDWLYVAGAADGVRIFDIRDPENPTEFASCDTPASAEAIVAGGMLAYVADMDGGLQIIELSSLLDTTWTDALPLNGVPNDITVWGDLALVATEQNGLEVIDVSDPTAMALVGSCATPGIALAVAIADPYAFVADHFAGITVVDVADPANPTVVTELVLPESSRDIALSGKLAYLACGAAGLRAVDTSDPTVPDYLGGVVTTGFATAIAVAGDHAYLATSTGLSVVDVSDPLAISEVGTYPTTTDAVDVVHYGNLVMLATSTEGVVFVDVSVPSAPVLDDQINTSGQLTRLAITGDLLYLNGQYGVSPFRLPLPYKSTTRHIDYSRCVAPLGDLVLAGTSAPSAIQAIEIAQKGFDLERLEGYSLPVNPNPDPILWARISTMQTGLIWWDLSVDGGASYQPMTPGDDWVQFTTPGTELTWWATLYPQGAHTNATVSELVIEWLHEYASINAISDVPNDQGKQVLVEWGRSGHEFIGDPMGVAEYAVYRKIDRGLRAAGRVEAALVAQSPSSIAADHARDMLALDWEFLTTVPARNQDHYAVTVPTLADSTVNGGIYRSVFMVSTLTSTPGLVFDSLPDSGYSVDNLAPGVPADINASYSHGGASLDWAAAPEDDVRFFRVYRESYPEFAPSVSNLLVQTAQPSVLDPVAHPWNYYYKITAVDFSGNEGAAGSPAVLTGTKSDLPPERTGLHAAIPNPFNARTTISFSLSSETHVSVSIYDLSGRHVVTLVDETRPAGRHDIIWNGLDSHESPVASGVYLYHLRAGRITESRRVVLVK